MSVVSVRRYSSVEEALVARSKLQAYGIPAWFPEEHAARCKWVYLQGASGCHIEVPASYAEEALFLLAPDPDFEISDYDAYEAAPSYRFAIWLALIGSLGYLGLFPLLDHLYCWCKKKKDP